MFLSLGGGRGLSLNEIEDEEDSLAHRLCEFTMKVLNEGMEDVFERFMNTFDQEYQNVEAAGETHEQYECYKEYLQVLEEKLAEFAMKEGYAPGQGAEFLQAVQQAIQEDKEKAMAEFDKFLQSMKESRRRLGDTDDRPDEYECLRELFQPQTVDDMVQAVLGMAEYETFSGLMRARVQQKKMIEKIKARRHEMMHGEMGLAHRFIDFGIKLLNEGMEPNYQRWLPLFDQEYQSVAQQGHTLEQYAAFQEYAQIIDSQLQNWVEQQGYGTDSDALYQELHRLEMKDQERVKAEMEKTMAEIERKKQQFRRELQEQSGQTDDAWVPHEPMLLVCKPRSLGDLIASFVHRADYKTFSDTMRMRVQQESFFKMLFGGSKPADSDAPYAILQDQVVDLDVPSVPPVPAEPQPADLAAPPSDGGFFNAAPEAASMSVVVPDGCGPGSLVTVSTPDGQAMNVTVPEGLSVGMEFAFNYTPVVSDAAAAASGGYAVGGYMQKQENAQATGGYTGGYAPTPG